MAKTRSHTTIPHGLGAAGMLEFFFERFDTSTASDSELDFLSGCSEAATLQAFSFSSLASNAACAIDLARESAHLGACERAGARIDHSTLLFQLASEFKLIGQMMHIASEADWCLRQRLSDRLRVELFRRDQTDEYSSREGA
ncbi:hypothetical protein AWB80_01647 [Caballeronia pedi]|uniref:Uncharacterized protein n=1 Tax=Caballeronia pedi TaxID=1777141 RepID=A0A158A0Z5_9BURK|nr:hypothetical protein [Caballeronia pedi]SAK51474.1 hypothetical protein AWB80_01647 [Caballeronia pedi]